jgi:hypothetical protein
VAASALAAAAGLRVLDGNVDACSAGSPDLSKRHGDRSDSLAAQGVGWGSSECSLSTRQDLAPRIVSMTEHLRWQPCTSSRADSSW